MPINRQRRTISLPPEQEEWLVKQGNPSKVIQALIEAAMKAETEPDKK